MGGAPTHPVRYHNLAAHPYLRPVVRAWSRSRDRRRGPIVVRVVSPTGAHHRTIDLAVRASVPCPWAPGRRTIARMTSFGLQMLDRSECVELLAAHSFGRVAVWTGEHPAVFPVLYGLLDGDIVIRTAPGEKLEAAVLHHEVAFEIDAAQPATHTGWSVNVVGPAEEIVDVATRERARALALESWAGDYRDDFIRIRARRVTGRRLASSTGALTTGP